MAVTDRRFADMSEEDITALIRRLPRREPSAALRARALSGAAGSVRRPGALRPAMALAALVVLFMADFMMGQWQEKQIAHMFPAPRSIVATKPVPAEDDMNAVDLVMSYRLAGLRPRGNEGETYLELRDRLLRNGEGG